MLSWSESYQFRSYRSDSLRDVLSEISDQHVGRWVKWRDQRSSMREESQKKSKMEDKKTNVPTNYRKTARFWWNWRWQEAKLIFFDHWILIRCRFHNKFVRMEIPAFRLLREGEIEWTEETALHWRLVEIPHSECYWKGLVSECSMKDTAYRTVLLLMTDLQWTWKSPRICEQWIPTVCLRYCSKGA